MGARQAGDGGTLEMNTAIRRFALPLLMVVLVLSRAAAAQSSWSGDSGLEFRDFFHRAIDPVQEDGNFSVYIQPEWFASLNDGVDLLTVEMFGRIDQNDDERTHADFRQLNWIHVADDWELRSGLIQVFWGVTEAVHLVDVINQTDLVENPDGEDKLGQPAVNLSVVRDWGIVDLFWMPYFRERTFPGTKGRLRTQPAVDTANGRYIDNDGRHHNDLALRWFHSVGDYDIGLSHFYGTGREPTLEALPGALSGVVLIPVYGIINQSGLDFQATRGDWLWKLEAIYRSPRGGSGFAAAAAGFEYTFVGVLDSVVDAGLLVEYLYDGRDKPDAGLFDDDIFIGTRLVFNDVQSTELLAGVIVDENSDSRFYNLEASRRLTDHLRLSVEARVFSNAPPEDPAFFLSTDDYVQIELGYYF